MKRYWKVMCDECGTVYPHQFVEPTQNNEDAMDILRKDGWIRLPDGDAHKDLCPICTEKENGVRV